MVQFENIGFSKDFYLDKKYIGSITLKETDREVLGYQGRRLELAKEDIKIKNKTIKKGQQFTTELIPLCGKIIKN